MIVILLTIASLRLCDHFISAIVGTWKTASGRARVPLHGSSGVESVPDTEHFSVSFQSGWHTYALTVKAPGMRGTAEEVILDTGVEGIHMVIFLYV